MQLQPQAIWGLNSFTNSTDSFYLLITHLFSFQLCFHLSCLFCSVRHGHSLYGWYSAVLALQIGYRKQIEGIIRRISTLGRVANDQQRRDFIAIDFRYKTIFFAHSWLLNPFKIFCFLFAGRPLSVSVAYSGRIAVAYKNGKSFKGKSIRDNKIKDSDTRYFDLVVSIYECESTGGMFLILKYLKKKTNVIKQKYFK